VKCWETIAERLSKRGWSWGFSKTVSDYKIFFVVDATRGDGRRFIVQSDQLLSAFLELENVTEGTGSR
jgi:hypothetical protein